MALLLYRIYVSFVGRFGNSEEIMFGYKTILAKSSRSKDTCRCELLENEDVYRINFY